MRIVEIGQYYMTKDTGDFGQFRSVACREYTLPRDDTASQPKGWIQRNMRIGPVLEVTTSFQHFKYGIEIRISSVGQDNSQSWVRISYGTIKYVIDSNHNNTEASADPQEDQKVTNKCQGCCSQIKGKKQNHKRGNLLMCQISYRCTKENGLTLSHQNHLMLLDATLGKLLDEAHREYADYRNPEGVSVSQSSLSVVFDRTGKPVGERNVDLSIGFGVTRNTYSAHSKFSENNPAEKMVDRSRKPVERNSSNAQIRTLLEEQRQMIIEEYCEKNGHHELQAAHAEEESRILREELWRQQMDFREVHPQSLTEMEELRKFQSSTFDTLARRKLIEDHNTTFGIIR